MLAHCELSELLYIVDERISVQGRRQVKKCRVDTHGVVTEREPITVVWGRASAGSRGRAPDQRVRGRNPRRRLSKVVTLNLTHGSEGRVKLQTMTNPLLPSS